MNDIDRVTEAVRDEDTFPVRQGPVAPDGHHYVVVGLPHIFPDGDHVSMLVRRADGEEPAWLLTDAADTLAHQWISGGAEDLDERHTALFDRLMDEYRPWVDDLRLDDNVLSMTVKDAGLSFAVHHFAHLMVLLSGVCMSQRFDEEHQR